MSEHRGSTDSVTKVQLTSSIQSAAWRTGAVAAGAQAPFEVTTLFVGEGSDVSVDVRTKSGKTVAKVSGKVYISRFGGAVPVPEKTDEEIYFEASLPKHGLTARSKLLKVFPPLRITNPKWDRKEARRGDVVKLSAETKGMPDGMRAKIAIYEHDADEAHDLITEFEADVKGEKIEAEWEYEYHEDTDEIPTEEEAEKGYNPPEYFFRVTAGGVSAESDLLEFKDWIEVRLQDSDGGPVADQDYIVRLSDGSEKRGKLGKDGRARVEDVPPGGYDVEFPGREMVTETDTTEDTAQE